MKKHIFLLLTLLLISAAAYSQENNESALSGKKEKEYKHNIGASVGFIAGNGISYRYWITEKYGIQTSLLPYYSKNEQEKDVNLSFGLMGLRMLNRTRNLNLFAYLGTRLQLKDYTSNYDMNRYERNETILTLGGGPGIEYLFSRLSLNLMGGVRGVTDFEDKQQITLSVESCLYYRF